MSTRNHPVRARSEEMERGKPTTSLTHNGKYRLPRTGEEVEALCGNQKWAHLLPGMVTREFTDATSKFAAPTGQEIMDAITEALAEIHRQGQGGVCGPGSTLQNPRSKLR